MPARAFLLYFDAKFQRDIYITDMLRYSAWGNVKEPEKIERYYNMVLPKINTAKPLLTKEILKKRYMSLKTRRGES